MRARSGKHYSRLSTSLLCAVVALSAVALSVTAKPLTGSGAIGTMVYQGVALVTTGEVGSSVLELGNNGQEIASSGDLYLRPLSMVAISGGVLQAVKLVKNSTTGRTDLYAPGGVCFSAGTCQDTWPAAGGASSLWKLVSGQRLETTTTSQSLQFVKTNDATASPNVLELVAQNNDTALGVNNTSGLAAQFSNGGSIQGDVVVNEALTNDEIVMVDTDSGSNYRVWHAGNDGHTASGIGPDASKIDGIPFKFYFFPTNSFASCGPNGVNRHCFCADVALTGALKCIKLQ